MSADRLIGRSELLQGDAASNLLGALGDNGDWELREDPIVLNPTAG